MTNVKSSHFSDISSIDIFETKLSNVMMAKLSLFGQMKGDYLAIIMHTSQSSFSIICAKSWQDPASIDGEEQK